MERARTHQIDKAAEKIFESRIPDGWVARKETPDYGIDFLVHIFDRKDPGANADIFATTIPTSERFAVQVKGVEDLKNSDGIAKYRLETKHLKYYVDTEPHPVYLVAVDVHKREAFWLFVQEYADEQLAGVNWRVQKKITINIPRSNVFVCDNAFREEVSRANRYMIMKKQRRVVAAILAEEQRLEKIDPRFDTQISLDSAGLNRHFTLKPSARLSCEFDFGSDAKRHEDFVCGRPVPFSPGEIVIDSPLFNLGEGGQIRVGSDLDATVLMTATDDPYKRLILNGTMVRGLEGGQFQTDPGPILFWYQFRLAGEHAKINAHLSLDLKHWHGRPITELERFDELDKFFGMGERSTVEMQWIINRIPGEPGSMQMPRLSDQWSHLLVGIRKAREIAREIGIVPVLPEGFGEAHKKSIDKIHALLFDGEYRVSAPDGNFTMTTSPSEAKSLAAHVGKNRTAASMKGFFPEHDSFLGHPIVVVMNEVALTWAKPKHHRVRQDLVEFAFSGTSRSEMIYRSAKEVLPVEEANRRFGRVEPEPESVHLDTHRGF